MTKMRAELSFVAVASDLQTISRSGLYTYAAGAYIVTEEGLSVSRIQGRWPATKGQVLK